MHLASMDKNAILVRSLGFRTAADLSVVSYALRVVVFRDVGEPACLAAYADAHRPWLSLLLIVTLTGMPVCAV